MKEILSRIITERDSKPEGKRHVDLFLALQVGHLTREEMNRVCFNELEQQRLKGKLRDSRYIRPKLSTDTEQDKMGRQRAIQKNLSDAYWLNEISVFRDNSETGLDMSLKEQQWYDYIVTGRIGHLVPQYLTPGKSVEPELIVESDDEIPF